MIDDFWAIFQYELSMTLFFLIKLVLVVIFVPTLVSLTFERLVESAKRLSNKEE